MWKNVIETKLINCHRSGFMGVYDALISWITREPRLVVQRPITLSLWINTVDNVVCGTKLEVGDAKSKRS